MNNSLHTTEINPDNFGQTFLTENPNDIYTKLTADFQGIITADQFTDMVNDFNRDVNSYYMKEKIKLGDDIHSIWLDDKDQKVISVHFDSENFISRMIIKPYITYPESDEKFTETTYSMPINDEWTVVWGGENEFVNYHYVYDTQRYAYDLLKVKNNTTFENNQLSNDNYFAFGADVTAPAFGKVVEVENNVKDNIPGEMNEAELLGNYVIIQHDTKEYSIIAHFKRDSIIVKEGDTVDQGELLGQCGNSGNSSEAHIHFQVMDKPDINKGKSIRIKFADGAQPVQGDVVTPSVITTSTSKKKSVMDTIDKADMFVPVVEILLFVPRLIGQVFRAIFN